MGGYKTRNALPLYVPILIYIGQKICLRTMNFGATVTCVRESFHLH